MKDVVNEDCTDLAALEAGDESAFSRLYDRHGAIIFSLCRRHTFNNALEEAEDATTAKTHRCLVCRQVCWERSHQQQRHTVREPANFCH